jgi:hypothetical protein
MLEKLDLPSNQFEDEGLAYISSALKEKNSINALNLGNIKN